MLGLVAYREPGEKNGPRTLAGVRFCAAYVERGEGLRAALSARRAISAMSGSIIICGLSRQSLYLACLRVALWSMFTPSFVIAFFIEIFSIVRA